MHSYQDPCHLEQSWGQTVSEANYSTQNVLSVMCKRPDTNVNRQNLKNKTKQKKTCKGICSHMANNNSFHLCKLQHKDNRQTTHR